MKVAIISDIHANLEALEATLLAISGEGADRMVCLGDIVGYNTNPAECLALLRGVEALCVAGNHDRAVTRQITTAEFSGTAARAVAWTRRRLHCDAVRFLSELPLEASIGDRLVAEHGALHSEGGRETVRLDSEERRRLSFEALVAHPSGARICAFGHTHQLGTFEFRDNVVRTLSAEEIQIRDDAYYLINPGTVGQPCHLGCPATYLVVDFARKCVTARHVAYDFSASVAKTRRAGLLPFRAYVPAPMRRALKRCARPLGLYRRSRDIDRDPSGPGFMSGPETTYDVDDLSDAPPRRQIGTSDLSLVSRCLTIPRQLGWF